MEGQQEPSLRNRVAGVWASFSGQTQKPRDNETQPLLSPRDSQDGTDTSIYLKLSATMFSFVVLGLLTATTGVLIPLVEEYYHLSDQNASFLFLAVPVGYVLAAMINQSIHTNMGQRGIAIIGPSCHVLAAIGAGTHPVFPLYLVFFAAGTFGIGILDASWCSWAGSLKKANTISGFLHGSFSVGAALGPFLLGTIASKGWPWYAWYYILGGIALAELIALVFAFRYDNAKKYHENNSEPSTTNESHSPGYLAVMKHRVVWICAAYYLMYVGTESAISGWVVTFLSRERHASQLMSSICSSCFWTGMAVGRVTLGPVTDKFGVRRAIMVYLSCAMVLGFPFALIENLVASAILLLMIGCFFGPLFPSGIVLLTAVTDKKMHVPAVSFVASMGQVGGALLPFAIGLVTERVGIRVFQVIILAQLLATLIVWIVFISVSSNKANVDNEEEHQD